MTTPMIQIWSGLEVRALREAQRLSIREFAARLGVSERMVSKWEAGADKIHPRPVNQAALDMSLASASADDKSRFAHFVSLQTGGNSRAIVDRRQEPGIEADPELDVKQEVRHPIDGKLMKLVDAGVYLCGPDNEPVFVSAFYIDVFPTTNADYARFVAATHHKSPEHWQVATEPPEEIADHPVVFVTWHDAAAYAAWCAKALPTAHQWEKSARGTRGDVYPWGNRATPAKCNVRETGLRSTTPVDRYHSGVSPFGAYDLCGNIWEWLSTESTPNRYELKGSAFTSPFERATPSLFNDASSEMLDDDTGFRCVTPAETMRALRTMST